MWEGKTQRKPQKADVISISGDFGWFLRVLVVGPRGMVGSGGKEEVKHSNMI